jgi:ribose/xylose/arabinose/galactoside ABC-type transport system permease subunit
VVVYLIVLAVIVSWLLGHTPAGCSGTRLPAAICTPVGGNREAPPLSGVNVGGW